MSALPRAMDPSLVRRLQDPARLAALRALCLEDGGADAAFDRLTRLAARLLRAPVALVNIVEVDRQVTRSAYGQPERFHRDDRCDIGDSICKYSVATGDPVIIDDTRLDPRSASSACVATGSSAYAGIPLVLRSGDALGSLCVLDDEPRHWTVEELDVLTELAAAATTELELLAMTRAAEGRVAAESTARRLAAVLSISDIALHQATLDDALHAVLGRLREVLAADTATVLLLEAGGTRLVVRASVGLEAEVDAEVSVPVGQGIAGRIAATRQPLIVTDVAKVESVSPLLRERVRSLLGAPLQLGTELLGVVHVGTEARRRFSEDDVRLLELASARIATAIERARLFEAERQARTEAERASRAKSEFLAVMSHELRTPLNVIGGHVQLLEEGVYGELTEVQRSPVARIRAGQRQLTGVIHDILQYVDIERFAPRPVGPSDPVALTDVVAELARRFVPACESRNIRCAWIPCVTAAAVRAPRETLLDILTRLLENAVKFTPGGGSIDITCDDAPDAVVVVVSNTGTTIPLEQWETIFDPFTRVDQSYRRAQEGVGLGLTIARARARQLGGDVRVRAMPDHAVGVELTVPR